MKIASILLILLTTLISSCGDGSDKASFSNTQGDLLLNGRGSRTPNPMAGTIYEVALYLPTKSTNAPEIISSDTNKTLEIVFSVDSELEKIKESFRKAFNNTCAPYCESAVKGFEHFLALIPRIKAGDRWTVAINGSSHAISYNGAFKSAVTDSTFGKALLNIYIGPKAIDDDLKDKLLGKK